MPFSKALTMIKRGKITDGLSIVALMKVTLRLKIINMKTIND